MDLRDGGPGRNSTAAVLYAEQLLLGGYWICGGRWGARKAYVYVTLSCRDSYRSIGACWANRGGSYIDRYFHLLLSTCPEKLSASRVTLQSAVANPEMHTYINELKIGYTMRGIV